MAKKKKNKTLLKVQSTQNFLPIQDVKEGIVITKDRRYVKILDISPINFLLRSPKEQNAIIQEFAAVLRVLPVTTQFKVISRRADVSGFVEKIQNFMNDEGNENCKRLQQEQIDLITNIGAREGISRRFFLIIQYEDAVALQKSSSFQEIRNELETSTMHIRNLLLRCGNDVTALETDVEIYKALYQIICKTESETKSFDTKMYETISRYLGDENYNPDKDAYIPANDFIAPKMIDTRQSSKYIVIDDVYYSFCYIPTKAFSNTCYGGWLSLLINLGEGIDVDLFLHKENIQTVSTKLSYALKMNKVKARGMEDTSTDFDDIKNAIDSGYYIKQGLSSGEDFCYMGVLLTISAGSEKELEWRTQQTKTFLLSQDLRLKTFIFQQEDAFLMSLPICQIKDNLFKKMRRNILTRDAASAYPFVAFEVNDENGIMMGINKANNSLVFIDNFDDVKYKNHNMTILGTSGAGKTYTLECMALRMREHGTQVFIIAPDKGHEFKRACDGIGGEFIKIAPGSKQNINIMEIRKIDDTTTKLIDGEDNTSILSKKIQQLHIFFSLLIPKMTYEETQYLDEALIRTYKKFGITHDNDSLISDDDPNKYKTMPILGDLHEVLKDMGDDTKRLYNMLSRLVTGSASSFNNQTNVNLDNKYIVLDVSTLTKEMLSVGMFIALDYVWDKCKEDRTAQKAVYLDELWTLIGEKSSKEAAEFVLEIFKTIRAYNGGGIAATQDLNDFFAKDNGRFGKGIINNSKIKYIMQLEQLEAENVQTTLGLSSTELQQVTRFERGEGLLIANTNHILLKVLASNTEHDLISTSAEDLSRIAQNKQIQEQNN